MSTQDHPPGDQADGAQDLQEAVETGGRCKWTLFKGAQGQEEMRWAQVAKHEISNRKRNIFFFHHEGGQTLAWL